MLPLLWLWWRTTAQFLSCSICSVSCSRRNLTLLLLECPWTISMALLRSWTGRFPLLTDVLWGRCFAPVFPILDCAFIQADTRLSIGLIGTMLPCSATAYTAASQESPVLHIHVSCALCLKFSGLNPPVNMHISLHWLSAKGNHTLSLDICDYTGWILAYAPLFPAQLVTKLFAEALSGDALEEQLVPLILWQGNPPWLITQQVNYHYMCKKRKCILM